MGEDGHKVEEIYKFPSTNKWVGRSSQYDFGATSKGIQPEAFEDLRQKYGIYTTFLQQSSPHLYMKVSI